MLCKSDAKSRSGVQDLKGNKHQLLHRIASVQTTLIYNNGTEAGLKYLTYITFIMKDLISGFNYSKNNNNENVK